MASHAACVLQPLLVLVGQAEKPPPPAPKTERSNEADLVPELEKAWRRAIEPAPGSAHFQRQLDRFRQAAPQGAALRQSGCP